MLPPSLLSLLQAWLLNAVWLWLECYMNPQLQVQYLKFERFRQRKFDGQSMLEIRCRENGLVSKVLTLQAWKLESDPCKEWWLTLVTPVLGIPRVHWCSLIGQLLSNERSYLSEDSLPKDDSQDCLLASMHIWTNTSISMHMNTHAHACMQPQVLENVFSKRRRER